MYFQALHKISLREVVCTKRVCDAVLSLLFTLVDFGVLADKNKRRMMQQDEENNKEKKEGEEGEEADGGSNSNNKKNEDDANEEEAKTNLAGDKKDVLSVHNTFMDVVVR